MPETKSWCYSAEHRELCRVIESQTLWCETTSWICLPEQDTVVGVHRQRLNPLGEAGAWALVTIS